MIIPMLLSGPLTFRAAGLANAVIERAKNLSAAGHDVVILVDVEQPGLDGEVVRLRRAGRILPNTRVVGLYNELRAVDRTLPHFVTIECRLENIVDLGAYMEVVDPNDPRISRFYLDDEYLAFRSMTQEKGGFVDLLRSGKRYSRIIFDERRRVIKIQKYDANNKLTLEEHLDLSGVVWLKKIFNSGRVDSIELTEGACKKTIFDSHNDLIAHWLTRYHSEILEKHVMISEWTFKRAALDKVADILGTRIVYAFHSSHLGPPYRYGSDPKPELHETLDAISTMDGVVVLTESQRIDLLRLEPHLTNIHVIPHVITQKYQQGTSRDNRLVIALGRLSPEKGIDVVLVEAFAKVVAKIPEARLEIYGRGPLESDIQREIRARGLEGNVSLMGFTDKPLEAYSKGAIALFPSKYEGQSLALAQALAAGCVPVGYDFKYGMSEAVRHGHNGLICDPGNVQELVDSICLLLINSAYCEELRIPLKEGFDQSNEAELFVEKWIQLFESLISTNQSATI